VEDAGVFKEGSMFATLLVVTFVIALVVAATVAALFRPAVRQILQRILADEIYTAWVRYLMFAIMVVGISSGVRVWELERYINPARGPEGGEPLVLNTDRWLLEVYRTVIGTMSGIAWLLLVFFIFTLIAYILVKIAEMRHSAAQKQP
jgi:hypothetical protein